MTMEQLTELQALRESYMDKGDYLSANIVTALICSTDYHDEPTDVWNAKRCIRNLETALEVMTISA